MMDDPRRAMEHAANADELVRIARKWQRVHSSRTRVFVSLKSLGVYVFPDYFRASTKHGLIPVEEFLR